MERRAPLGSVMDAGREDRGRLDCREEQWERKSEWKGEKHDATTPQCHARIIRKRRYVRGRSGIRGKQKEKEAIQKTKKRRRKAGEREKKNKANGAV